MKKLTKNLFVFSLPRSLLVCYDIWVKLMAVRIFRQNQYISDVPAHYMNIAGRYLIV